ncbi:hypothetical protein PRZ48_000171 [Zasmidium cellare]|uniref:BTB domain-containing protein n=1 Tax=Zasmidium cellare TaxID=395010 RepID=A0ABR0EXR0_ZASCE|nr:hypothetical protein PRZ48_000171 [Zasmidium cellare]
MSLAGPRPREAVEFLEEDRLVSIYIGDKKKPYLIQQTIITMTSDYFKAAFTNERFEEAKSGILRVPDDDIDTWALFMYWLVKRELPCHVSDIRWAVKAWTFGDKYGISQFQNAAMLEVLSRFNLMDLRSPADVALVEEAFVLCPQGSLMRKFLAEQVVAAVLDLKSTTWEDLAAIREPAGNCKDILDAIVRREHDNVWNWQLGDDGNGKPIWARYMIGEGPANVEMFGWIKLDCGWTMV